MTEIHGIDIHEEFQVKVDYGALKEDPNWNMKFMIEKGSEGWGWEPDGPQDHQADAKNQELLTGMYHYFYAADGDTHYEAIKQAEFAVEVYRKKDYNLPLVLDLEDKNSVSFAKVGNNAIVAQGALWCLEEIEKLTGRTPILYTGKWYMQLIPFDEQFTKYPLWIASYPPNNVVNPGWIPYMPNAWEVNELPWAIHQFSSKYRNYAVARTGFRWLDKWYPTTTANVDINRTTQAKMDDLLGIAPPAPPAPDCELQVLAETKRVLGLIDNLRDEVAG